MRVTNRTDRYGIRSGRGASQLIAAAAVSALALQSGKAMASSIWTGPSGTTAVPTTGFWNTATNWSATGVPAGGVSQELDFLGGSTVYTSTDDISGVFSLNSLVLNDIGSTIAAGGGNSLSFQGTSPAISQSAAGAFTISAPVDISSNTSISVANGGEIDFTGAVTTGSSNGISISNSSGTGNATVKFTGSNTHASVTINPNVTVVAGLSTNLTTLGAGPITLSGGTLLLQGQQSTGFGQQPIGVTGFNADTIIDAAAALASPAYPSQPVATFNGAPGSGSTTYLSSAGVQTQTISAAGEQHNQTLFFQNGWSKNGNQTGLPAGGYFSSAYTNINSAHTGFSFAYNGTASDFAHNNTLYFTNFDSGAKTLNLTTPGTATTLDFLATALFATTFNVTLNFSDSTTDTYTSAITTGPLATTGAPANVALANVTGTNEGNSNDIDNGGFGKMHLTENDISLLPADQSKTITSITFTPTTTFPTNGTSGSTAAIYAVSGTGIFGTFTFPSQAYSNNVNVTADTTIAVSNSLTATMGNLSIGSNKLSITSADTTGSPYSVTVGNVTLSGNPTFDAKKSTGNGVGTLNLGALNDGGTARTITISSDSGVVAFTAAATQLSSGTNINVPTGATLTVAASNAVGAATVNVNGGTVNGTSSDGVSGSGTGIYVVNTGTLNEVAASGLGSLAQVTMNGGTLNITTGSQLSSLNGNAGTVTLNNQFLRVGNTDNLSSTFGGSITSTSGSNFIGALGVTGGTLTLTGTNNSVQFVGANGATLVVGANSTVNGSAYTAAVASPLHGPITGPVGFGTVAVGNSAPASTLLLDSPGRSLPNVVAIGSGSASSTKQTIGGANTSGVVTYGGDIYLGSGDQGFYGVTGTAVLGATDGGEVDFNGNIIANHDIYKSDIQVSNLTASPTLGATVKFSGLANTYRGGTTINPSVTLVSALTPSAHPLGYGPVNLIGGTLSLQGQQASGTQQTVGATGFNQKVIVPTGSTSAASATTVTIDGTNVLYQNGYTNTSAVTGPYGLTSPTNSSEYNPDVHFTLQPFNTNSDLQLTSAAGNSGTLTLSSPASYKTINLLTSGGTASTTINVKFNFSDTTSETQTLYTQNSTYAFYNNAFGASSPQISDYSRLAIGGILTGTSTNGSAVTIGSIARANDAFSGVNASSASSLYEDDYTLAPADQSKTLSSIQFTVANGNSSVTNIMAVSGQTYVAPTTLATQTYANNVTVTDATNTTGTINVSGSLNAVMGNNLSMGNNTLLVGSSDVSGGAYSLTLGTLPDTLDTLGTAPAVSLLGSVVGQGPTFNVANSAGGGIGTLVLGSLDDTNAFDPNSFAHIPQVINKNGAGVLTLSAPAKVPTSTNTSVTGETSALQGATVNVNVGTLNSNDPTALGSTAIVTVATNLNFGANDNTGTAPVPVTVASLSVGAAANVSVLNASSQADRTVLVVTGPNGLSVTTGGIVELNKNDMIVHGGDLPTITAELKSGYASGTGHWNGPGIRSTSAGADLTFLTTLGVMASTGANFDGQPTTAGDVLVKFTYYGDTNLDGHVDGTDYSVIDSHNGLSSGAQWSQGDFNYDGKVDGSDYSLIDNTFNQQSMAGYAAQVASPTSEIAGGSAVPEPATLGLFGISAIGLLSRRRRRE